MVIDLCAPRQNKFVTLVPLPITLLFVALTEWNVFAPTFRLAATSLEILWDKVCHRKYYGTALNTKMFRK